MRDPQGWRQRNIRTVKQRNGERLPEWACLADTQIGRAGVHLGEHGEEKITPNKGGPAGFFQPVLSFTVQYRNRCLNGHKKVRQKYDRTLPWTYSLFTPAEQMVLENRRLAGTIDPLGPFTRRRSLVRVQQSPPRSPEIVRFQDFFFFISLNKLRTILPVSPDPNADPYGTRNRENRAAPDGISFARCRFLAEPL